MEEETGWKVECEKQRVKCAKKQPHWARSLLTQGRYNETNKVADVDISFTSLPVEIGILQTMPRLDRLFLFIDSRLAYEIQVIAE